MNIDMIEVLEERFSLENIIEFLTSLNKDQIEDYAVSKNICPKCFSSLILNTWKEEREYQGSPAFETMSELTCEGCGDTYQ